MARKLFAAGTNVSPAQTKMEIEGLVGKYGATAFIAGSMREQVFVAFEMNGCRIRFNLKMPGETTSKAERETRRLWRCMMLCIKSKLESVASGIVTFEEEFLAHVVMPDNSTVGERMLPELKLALKSGKLPPLLPGPVAGGGR